MSTFPFCIARQALCRQSLEAVTMPVVRAVRRSKTGLRTRRAGRRLDLHVPSRMATCRSSPLVPFVRCDPCHGVELADTVRPDAGCGCVGL